MPAKRELQSGLLEYPVMCTTIEKLHTGLSLLLMLMMLMLFSFLVDVDVYVVLVLVVAVILYRLERKKN